jgi:hypothetical protein
VSQQTPKNDPVQATINAGSRSTFSGGAEPSTSRGITLEPPTIPSFGSSDLPPLNSDAPVMDDIQMMSQNTFDMSGMSQHEWGMIEPGRALPVATPQNIPEPEADEVVSIDFNAVPQPAPIQTSPSNFTLSPQELESMIRSEVERALQQMQSQLQSKMEQEVAQFSQANLPALAEKIIKEQIHKLLSEPPM